MTMCESNYDSIPVAEFRPEPHAERHGPGAVIETRGLRKSFKKTDAVKGVDLEVCEGDLFGLLGPNGAGKSTTINLILGLLKPDGGSVQVLGCDAHRLTDDVKRQIGYVPQDMAFFEDLSGIDNVTYWGKLNGLRGAALAEAVHDALNFTGLWDRRKDKAKNYSGGMQRRLNISCAIVHNPSVLIMDEPTVGVDPQSRNAILESVKALAAGGTTVVYTSHYMEEIEALCDKVAIMDHGEIIASGGLQEVVDRHTDERVVEITLASTRDAAEAAVRLEAPGLTSDRIEVDGVKVRAHLDKGADFAEFARCVLATSPNVAGLSEVRLSLEAVFLSLTGKTLRD